jgi:HEAT repeat protein
VRRLADLGTDAKDALPALLKLIQAPLAGVKRSKTDMKDMSPDVRKRFEEGEEKYRREAEEHLRSQAVEAVTKIGPSTKPALEMLVKMLDAPKDSVSRSDVFKGLAKADPAHGASLAPAVPALVKEIRNNTSLKDETLAALAAAGPAAKAAAADVIALLGSSRDDRKAVLKVIAAIGPAAEPELVKALRHEKDAVRAAVAETLGESGAKAAAPALADALKADASQQVRLSAIEALLKLKPPPKEVLPAVVGALQDPGFPAIRHTAVQLLAAWGPDAAEAALPLAEFARALKDKDQEERERCLKAVAGMGAAAAQACATILKILEDKPVVYMRRAVEETLLAVGEGALPALTDGLKSPQPYVRATSAEALGRIGPPSRSAVPALIEAMKDADLNGARLPSIEALGRIGPGAEAAIPALVQLFDDDRDNSFRNAAAGALLRMGGKAVPTLEGLLLRKDDWLEFGLGHELGKLGPEDKGAVPFLVKGARQKGWKARMHAASALGKIGVELPAAAEAFADLFPGESDEMKAFIADRIAELGSTGAAAAGVLVTALGDANGAVRNPCAKALPQVDPEGTASLPLLRSTLEKGSPVHRELAAEIIGSFGPKAAGAAEALRAAMRDEDYFAALAAEEALKRVTGP